MRHRLWLIHWEIAEDSLHSLITHIMMKVNMLKMAKEVKIYLIQRHQITNSYMSTFNAIIQASAQMAMMLKFHAHGKDFCIYNAWLIKFQELYISQSVLIHFLIIVILLRHHIHLDHKQHSILIYSQHASTLWWKINHSIPLGMLQI